MMAIVLGWGYDSRLELELWQLFCGGDTTVVWLSNCGSCFVLGIRQCFGYRMMAVVLWWGYDCSLDIE
jgi:hypothetical protein